MFQNLPAFITVLSPAIFAATALVSRFQPGIRPAIVKRMSVVSTVTSILIAIVCGIAVANNGILQTKLVGFNGLGFSLRLDALSVAMLIMIALLGFIIVKFSLNYLDGDKRQGAFLGRLAATIASVQLLVLSANLFVLLISWVLTSISLHRLLVFYAHRPGALVAARKKYILARLGDLCLLVAVLLLYREFGTGDFEMVFAMIKERNTLGLLPASMEGVAVLLVLVAILKSAQFPTHGWLIEVMETPTPVSALLHAGLLNAGPFLIIRMAHIIDASVYAPYLLIIVGGFTALFGSVIYLTQTSIKTALAYSSIAHMGFSLLVCGFGIFPAAMLHLVGHSFYKAHAFLSSGSAIDVIKGNKIASLPKSYSLYKIAAGILLALVVYSGFIIVWGIDVYRELPLVAIGSILVMGLSRIFILAIDKNGGISLFMRASLMVLFVAGAFFSLESGAHYILSSQVPELHTPGVGKALLVGALLLVFGTVVLVQVIAPTLSKYPIFLTLAVHLRNGLYVNTIFDRVVSALRIHSPENKLVVQQQDRQLRRVEYLKMDQLKEQAVFINKL
ncbi:NADH/ubiquinone/plastoquinone (complex i) [Fulvivirga sp. 29W222]|uniref:Probable inorganic carbon transporter subunit DabB n=1 Tax=Fulvivirga marina TaxID=2494733 RepID=A0A937G0F3_9BACT|nr:proton-conducting transporter membrane subunit [Fulvivirga marina]MBL6448243.1 NADH/ubiquinone/plastoquinone (complex i) [Fulvivirga marina]